MGKITTNILKGTIGKLPQMPQAAHGRRLSWFNIKLLKHQEDVSEKVFHIGDLVIHYRRPYELLHTYTEIFANEIYKFRAGKDAPLVLDCGTNIGMSMLYFKKLYPKARLVAFEPDAANFSLLQKNAKANNLSDVTLHNAAVWTANGTLSFSSAGSEASHVTTDGSGGQLVQSIRLADILSAEETIDFLKIDIEGAEWPVVQDCASYFNKVQHLFLEYHGKTSESGKLAGLMEIIARSGFSVYVQNAADALPSPFLNKTTNTIYDVQLNLYCFKA